LVAVHPLPAAGQNEAEFFDDFEDGNANGWSPKTPSVWEVVQDQGSWRYHLKEEPNEVGEYSVIDSLLVGDFTLSLDARIDEDWGSHTHLDSKVYFAFQDENNYYHLNLHKIAAYSTLLKRVDGKDIYIAGAANPFLKDDQYHTYTIERRRAQIRVLVDGEEYLSTTDGEFGEGKIGLGTYRWKNYFDNVRIEVPEDRDGDGMPDWWEDSFGDLDPAGDNDGDGLSNLDEYGYDTHPFNEDTDNDGVSDGQEVLDGTDPNNANDKIVLRVEIHQPTSLPDYKTSSSQISLSGIAEGVEAIDRIEWQHLGTDETGIGTGTENWGTEAINLVEGENVIQVTVFNNQDQTAVDEIMVNYQIVNGPLRITNIDAATQGSLYEKFELDFEIENSVAENFQFPYDAITPNGLESGIGISVDGLFLPPGETNWNNAISQPAFFYQPFERINQYSNEGIYPNGKPVWKLRFAPTSLGQWQFKIRAEDASGTAESEEKSFEVIESSNEETHGFVRVSPNDVRYFQFDDGSTFVGGGTGYNFYDLDHVDESLPDLAENGATFFRIWDMMDILGTSWVPYVNNLDWNGYFPSSGLTLLDSYRPDRNDFFSMKIDAGNPCVSYGWWRVPAKPSTEYRLMVRIKVVGVDGPRDPDHDYGFVVKTGDWTRSNEVCSSFESDQSYLLGPIKNTKDRQGNYIWQSFSTVIFTDGSGIYSNNHFNGPTMALENTNSGAAYMDEISLREILDDGSLGPEIIKKSKMNMHTYFDQYQSYVLDYGLNLAEDLGLYFKINILEKNDEIFNKIDWDGNPVSSGSDNNFYGGWQSYCGDGDESGGTSNNTAVRCLHTYYWRYLIARWGYSRAVHSWELLNEGDPFNGVHYTQAQALAKFMRDKDPNQHLTTTSFWHSFPKDEFWANPSYPDIGYADKHEEAPENDKEKYDCAYYVGNYNNEFSSLTTGIDMPLIVGEAYPGAHANPELDQDTEGVYFHNFIWAHVHPGGAYALPFYITPIENNNLWYHYKPYDDFMSDIPLPLGNYQDAEVIVSDDNLRAWGQKGLANGQAHLWIQNKQHTWRNVVDGVSIQPVSGTVTIPDMPSGNYRVEWWHTYTGEIIKTDHVQVSSDLVLTLPYPLEDDIAVKAQRAPASPSNGFEVYLPLVWKGWEGNQ